MTFNKQTKAFGWHNLIKRSVLLKAEILNQGTLTIDLRIKVVDTKKVALNFIPKNPFSKHMSKLLLEDDSVDVMFELAGDSASPNVQYHAHLLVLKACAPDLARLCEGSDESTPVLIADVDHQVFY
mmetsp:Transcript_35731/g.75227  ORF Transcript_35731/g.75227 Transcript_35731/m.75227 type:complete len:126 (-) Transcript_35731:92-469(-)